ncbi:hypothetical protein CYMTET_41281 [Cymbomonas tetramitiformis]|uniref:Uncharacterized protein n=1 Tax=Cymbomonas tetramitiformis TaxID=36881 RepID=A0AAE0F253_9CHLO|nr:hypothetical protein CYMTET_41281 [Cymbomonas tetramitiformis]
MPHLMQCTRACAYVGLRPTDISFVRSTSLRQAQCRTALDTFAPNTEPLCTRHARAPQSAAQRSTCSRPAESRSARSRPAESRSALGTLVPNLGPLCTRHARARQTAALRSTRSQPAENRSALDNPWQSLRQRCKGRNNAGCELAERTAALQVHLAASAFPCQVHDTNEDASEADAPHALEHVPEARHTRLNMCPRRMRHMRLNMCPRRATRALTCARGASHALEHVPEARHTRLNMCPRRMRHTRLNMCPRRATRA